MPGGSGRRREDLGAAAGTAGRDAASQRGDATAVCKVVQLLGRPRDDGVDRVPRSLRPDGATQRRREGRCSHGDGLERTAPERRRTAGRGTTARRGNAAVTRVGAAVRRTTWRRRCGLTGRRSGSPMLDRWRGALNSETIFTGPAEARVTDGPGRSRGVDEADRGGEWVIKPIAREVGDAARWRRGGSGVRDEADDSGQQGGYDWPPHGARPPGRGDAGVPVEAGR